MPLSVLQRCRQYLADLRKGRELTMTVLTNAAWQSSDSVVRLLVGMVIGVWTARYLGTEDYGRLSFALALVGMVASLPSLGIQQLVIRDMVKNPLRTPQILGTVFALKSVFAAVAFAIVLGLAFTQRHHDSLSMWLAMVVGARLLLVPLNLAEVWTHAQLKSRYSAMARNVSFLVTSLVRVGLLLSAVTVFEFAVAAVFETALSAGLLFWVRRRMGCPAFAEWRFDKGLLRTFARDAWPMTLAMLVGSLFARADQVLLKAFCSNHELGVYAATRQIPLLLGTMLAAVSNAAMPALVQTYESNRPVFHSRLRLGVQGAWLVGLAAAALFALLPDAWVVFIFGPQYLESARVLHWCALSFPLSIVATATKPFYIVHDLRVFLLTRSSINLVVWLLFAIPLIQLYGYVGAIVATLAGQLVGIGLDFTSPLTREIGVVKLKSLAFLYLLPRHRREADRTG